MMRIAIVGVGLAGLAIGWHLLQEGCRVVFFDTHEVGKGASGVAAGLVHPYVGEKARRNWKATEGLEEMERLLAVSEAVLGYSSIVERGLVRIALNDVQRSHLKEADDVEEIAPDEFLIHSGATVDVPSYLKGLFHSCERQGAQLVRQKVSLDKPLQGFDHTVFAVGSGWVASSFARPRSLKLMKGQVLLLRLNQPLKRSRIAKGYLAKTFDPHLVYLGATYEKQFQDAQPCFTLATQELLPKLSRLLGAEYSWEVLECRAGVRLCWQGEHSVSENYFHNRLKDNCWWLAGLGSKGLLYHAYLAKKLAYDILSA